MMVFEDAESVRVIVRHQDGFEIDVTDDVRLIYDLLNLSMDYSSGFLAIEDVVGITRLAQVAGFTSIENAEQQLGAYIRHVGSQCPACYKVFQHWYVEYKKIHGTKSYWNDPNNPGTGQVVEFEMIKMTPTGRLFRAKPCGHFAEISMIKGEPAGFRWVDDSEI